MLYKAHVVGYLRSLAAGRKREVGEVAEGLVRDENAQYGVLAALWIWVGAYWRGYHYPPQYPQYPPTPY